MRENKHGSPFLHYTLPVPLFSLIWGAVEFLMPVLYSEADLKIGLVAILFAVSSGLSVLLDIPAGRLSDRIGRERLITAAMVISVIALALLYFFSSLPVFIISSVLIGIAYGLNWSPLLAFVGDRSEEGGHGSVFGDFFVLGAIGEALAPLLMVGIIFFSSTQFPFLILALMALLCAFIFVRLVRPSTQRIAVQELSLHHFSYRGSWNLIMRSKHLNFFLLATGFFVAFFWQSVWFTQPLIGFYETTLLDSALIVATFSLPSLIFSKPMGKLIDSAGERKVFFASIVIVIFAFILFFFSALLWQKILFIFIGAVGVLGVWLVLDVLVVKTNKAKERGEFFGILETVRDGSYVVTPLFIGATYMAIGLQGVFLVNAGLAFLLFILGFWILKKERLDKAFILS